MSLETDKLTTVLKELVDITVGTCEQHTEEQKTLLCMFHDIRMLLENIDQKINNITNDQKQLNIKVENLNKLI